jgi:hypothetical protein
MIDPGPGMDIWRKVPQVGIACSGWHAHWELSANKSRQRMSSGGLCLRWVIWLAKMVSNHRPPACSEYNFFPR